MSCYLSSTLLLLLATGLVLSAETPICLQNKIPGCCSGYIMNETSGQCEKCFTGYTGHDCIYKCSYPYYGEDCFMKCDCTAEMCDFVSGCKATSTTANQITTYTDYQLSSIAEEEYSNDSSIGSPSVSKVFYTTVGLISVCVISFLTYGLLYMRKMFISRQKNETSEPQFKNASNVYECADFPNHI